MHKGACKGASIDARVIAHTHTPVIEARRAMPPAIFSPKTTPLAGLVALTSELMSWPMVRKVALC